MALDLIMLIGQVGFPIAITAYLLYTRDSTIKNNTDALNELKTEIALLRESKK